MTKSKYPSLASLTAQGYPGARQVELARQADERSRKAVRDAAKRKRESLVVDALVAHVTTPMRQNDLAGVEKALLDVGRYLKV